MERKDIEEKEEMDASQYGFTSLEVVTLEKLVFYTPFTSSPKERVTVLKEAMHSVLASLRTCSDAKLKVSLKGGKGLSCLPKLFLYCFDVQKAKYLSFTRHRTSRYHLPVRCTISFEETVQGRKILERVLSAANRMGRKMESLK